MIEMDCDKEKKTSRMKHINEKKWKGKREKATNDSQVNIQKEQSFSDGLKSTAHNTDFRVCIVYIWIIYFILILIIR